jgi:hypothetical protein
MHIVVRLHYIIYEYYIWLSQFAFALSGSFVLIE